MIIVSIAAFCLAALIFLDCLIRGRDLFSPERFYLFFHAIGTGVAFLAMDDAMTPFRPLTSLVYFGSAACFVLGVRTVYLLARKPEDVLRPDRSRYNWRLHLGLSLILFTVFVTGILVAYFGAGEFPMFAKKKGEAIKTFFEVSTPSSIALSYGGVSAFLFFMYAFRDKAPRLLVNAGFWMALLSLLIFSLALSRSGIMFFAFAALLYYNYSVRRLPLWKLSLAFFLFAAVILATGYQKSYEVASRYNLKPEKVIQLAFTVPYMYFANNYWNLDYALNPENHLREHPQTYGFVTASGILDFIYMPGSLGANFRETAGFDNQFNKTSIKVRGWNTISYQWSLYKEFGVMGVLAGAYFLGALLGLIYLRLRSQPTILNVAVYSFLGYFIALSMFGYFPEASVYVYGLMYVAGTCFLCQNIPGPRDAPERRIIGT